jgi:4-amino-4-deoxy-L-arabinose transferase-like glycosyltransferase
VGRYLAPAFVALLVLGFFVISVWWQNVDQRIPDGDYGKHLLISFGYYDLIKEGYWGAPFRQYNFYPPLTHLVSAWYSVFAGGASVVRMVVAENLVFVPLLGFGCYWAGSIAFDRLAGALAAMFALGVPMVISLFHAEMTDGPTAGMVAITVAAMLASDRFSRTRMSALAGALAGVGMYTRGTFALFIIGLFAVMLVRGGWRSPRGALIFLALGALIAGPWYLVHYHDLLSQTSGAASGQQPLWYGGYPYPSRTDLLKYTWYGWDMINVQLYVPLTIFFIVGLIGLSVRWLRDRTRESLVPELVIGGFVSYLTISLITLEDPRYSIPALVYVAVLGTAWITMVRTRPIRILAAGALTTVVVINTAEVNKAWPGWNTAITLPGAPGSPIGQRSFTFFSTAGYVNNQPQPAPALPAILSFLKGLKRAGIKSVAFDPPSLNGGGYNLNSMSVIAHLAGLKVAGYYPALVTNPQVAWVFRTSPFTAHHAYCLKSPAVPDGTGFYAVLGPLRPYDPIFCPRLVDPVKY